MTDITWTRDHAGTEGATVKIAGLDVHAELSVGVDDMAGYSVMIFDDLDDPNSMPVFEAHDPTPMDVAAAKVAAEKALRDWVMTVGRYLVFGFDTYYPEGGANDLVGRAETLDAGKDLIIGSNRDHHHIYDTLTGETYTP